MSVIANFLSTLPEDTMFENPLYDGASTTRKLIPMTEIREELTAELNRGAEKAEANRKLYDEVHDIVMDALSTETPVTIAELYSEIEGNLPEGFSKGKVQYAVTRLWADEVVKHEGKTNGYTRKA